MAKSGGVTFSNSHAATADAFSDTDQQADTVQVFNLTTQDPASAVLYSIGGTDSTMTTIVGNVSVPTDLMSRDAVGFQIKSTLGATVTILNGSQVSYDTTAIASTVIDKLGAGQTTIDSFHYAIQMGNGTVAWNTVSITLIGEAAKITAADNGVQEDVGVNAAGNLTDTATIGAFAASGNATTFTITPAAGNLGSLSALGGSGNTALTYTVSNVALYNTHLGFGEFTHDTFTVTTANGTTLNFTETIEGNIHAATIAASAAQASIDEGQSTQLNIAATDHDDNASLTYQITGVPAGASLTSALHPTAVQYDAQTGAYSIGAAALADLTFHSVEDGPVTLVVKVTNTESDGTTTVTAASTANINIAVHEVATAPHLAAPTALDGMEGSALALGINASAAESDQAAPTILISGVASDASLSAGIKNSDGTWSLTAAQLGSLTLTPGEAEEGVGMTLTVTATDKEFDTQASSTQTINVTVHDALPTITTPAVTGTAQEGQTLTASASSGQSDNPVTYQWQTSADNGASWHNIVGATSASYTATEGGEHSLLRAVATATNDDGITISASSAATSKVLDALPTVTAPAVTGTAQEGQNLMASASSGQSDNPVTYQWQTSTDNGASWHNIVGATSASYTATEVDEHNLLRAVATATNDDGIAISASSAATAKVLDAPPTVTTPTIAGTAQEGQTLTASASTGQSDNPVTYQWQESSDGGHTWTNIANATGATYAVTEGDEHNLIQAVATATNDDGVTISATSAATSKVLDAAPAFASSSGELLPGANPYVYTGADASSGNVVGSYVDATGSGNHGFLYSHATGTFTVLDAHDPTAVVTPTAVNASGAVAGNLSGAATGYSGQAFLFAGGNYMTIQNGIATNATALSADDIVGGNYYVGDGNNYGYLYNNGHITNLPIGAPDGGLFVGFSVTPQAIGAGGAWVAGYSSNGIDNNNEGWVYSNGHVTYLNAPDAGHLAGKSMSETYSLNFDAAGDVAGTYKDAGGTIHGFVYSNGAFHEFDAPTGGHFIDTSGIVAVGSGGEAAGAYMGADGHMHGLLYSNGTVASFDAPGGGNISEYDNSYWGVAAGSMAISPDGREVAGTYNDGHGHFHGFAYDNGQVTSFDVAGAQTPNPKAIDAFGDIVGNTETFNGYYNQPSLFILQQSRGMSLSGTAREGQTLTASVSAAQSDNLVTYQWQSSSDNGTTWHDIAGATGATYALGEGNEHNLIRAMATVTNDDGVSVSQATSATSPVLDALPTVTTPTITGMAQEGQTLTALASSSQSDNPVTYQWQTSTDGGATYHNIAGATGATYTIQESDEHNLIEVVATATNDNGLTASAISAAAGAPVPATTTLSGAVTADNEVRLYVSTNDSQLGTLLTTGNNWSASSAFSGISLTPGVTNYLHVVGINVGGPGGVLGEFHLSNTGFTFGNGTGSDYTSATDWKYSLTGFGNGYTTPVDEGANGVSPWGAVAGILPAAHWLWSHGQSTSDTNTEYFSLPVYYTAGIADAAPTVSTPTIAGTVQQGQTLTASATSGQGDNPLTYQWQESSDGGHTWANIAGASGVSYALASSDVGKEVDVVATVTNENGLSVSAVSTATTSVVALDPPIVISDVRNDTLASGAAASSAGAAGGNGASGASPFQSNISHTGGSNNDSLTIGENVTGGSGGAGGAGVAGAGGTQTSSSNYYYSNYVNSQGYVYQYNNYWTNNYSTGTGSDGGTGGAGGGASTVMATLSNDVLNGGGSGNDSLSLSADATGATGGAGAAGGVGGSAGESGYYDYSWLASQNYQVVGYYTTTYWVQTGWFGGYYQTNYYYQSGWVPTYDYVYDNYYGGQGGAGGTGGTGGAGSMSDATVSGSQLVDGSGTDMMIVTAIAHGGDGGDGGAGSVGGNGATAGISGHGGDGGQGGDAQAHIDGNTLSAGGAGGETLTLAATAIAGNGGQGGDGGTAGEAIHVQFNNGGTTYYDYGTGGTGGNGGAHGQASIDISTNHLHGGDGNDTLTISAAITGGHSGADGAGGSGGTSSNTLVYDYVGNTSAYHYHDYVAGVQGSAGGSLTNGASDQISIVNNTMDGGAGDNTLKLQISATSANGLSLTVNGNDFNGGSGGHNTLDLSGVQVAGVTVDLSTGQFSVNGATGTNTVENIQTVIGTGLADTLVGNGHGTVLTGGGGADLFEFHANGSGANTITDFLPGTAHIDLLGASFASTDAALAAVASDSQGNAVVNVDAHDSVTLTGVHLNQLHSSDFMLG